MKKRKFKTIKLSVYKFKTYSDNNETVVYKNNMFCCILPTLKTALNTFKPQLQ